MKINLILARSINNGIGINNTLPWHFKKDLKHFYNLTTQKGFNAVVMGRKTWDSLPNKVKPLPKRDNYVITRNRNFDVDNNNVDVYNCINDCIQYCRDTKYDNLWIIGGSSIYNYVLEHNLVDNLYITTIHKEYDCDTFINNIDEIKQNFNLYYRENVVEKNVDLTFDYYRKL